MKFKVQIFESDPITKRQEKGAEIELPFPPFHGLWLEIPWRRMDFHKVVDVYWSGRENRFIVYFESPD